MESNLTNTKNVTIPLCISETVVFYNAFHYNQKHKIENQKIVSNENKCAIVDVVYKEDKQPNYSHMDDNRAQESSEQVQNYSFENMNSNKSTFTPSQKNYWKGLK